MLIRSFGSTAKTPKTPKTKEHALLQQIVTYMSRKSFFSQDSALQILKAHKDKSKVVDLRSCLIEENHLGDIAAYVSQHPDEIKTILFPQNFINFLRTQQSSDKATALLARAYSKTPNRDVKFNEFIDYVTKEQCVPTIEELEEDSQRIICDMLAYYSQYEEYFYFCANLLFELAHSKISTAKRHFFDCFYYASSYTNVSLYTKMKTLKRITQTAIQSNEEAEYKFPLLTDALSLAADPYETGETSLTSADYHDSHHLYTRRAIAMLIILCGSTSQAVEDVFKGTYTGEVSGEMPEYILKTIAENRAHVDYLKTLIDASEASKSLRLVFSTYPFHALFMADDFSLMRAASTVRKKCAIADYLDDGTYTLHQRQSLAERLIFKETCYIMETPRGYPKLTYLIVNFGLIVSDRPVANNKHKRIFISAPVLVSNKTIFGNPEKYQEKEHAEECFINYFKIQKNLTNTLKTLIKKYAIKSQGHKVYGAVFDMHGTYDMCVSCYCHLFEFLGNFKSDLIKMLATLGFMASISPRFAMVIRYSSDMRYHYNDRTTQKDKGVIHQIKAPSITEINTDIADGDQTLIIHSTHKWLNFWENQIKSDDVKIPARVKLENWTAFSSATGCVGKSEEQLNFNYTRLGYAELNDKDHDTEKLAEDLSGSLHL